MSQNSRSNQQQGLQRQATVVEAAAPLTRVVPGVLTRLPNRGSVTTRDYTVAAELVEQAYEVGNVVAPGSPTIMPEGYGVVITRIDVRDFDKYGDDLYPIQGSAKMGLHKGILDDIGRGYGIDWPPEWTFVEPYPEGDPRNGNPFCLKITVCGRYKDYDGGWKTLPPQTKDIDLRDFDPVNNQVPAEVEQIRTRHEYNETKDLPKDATQEAINTRLNLARKKADAELAQNRKFIRSYAQTKARLMVIGTIVRRAYTVEQLKKGFFCVKVVQTWQSEDPIYKKAFADAIVQREMAGSTLLWGGGNPTQPRQLPVVSDQPYPEDVGVVGEVTPEPAGENVEEGETPAPRQCTPDECLGKGARHVAFCLQPVDEKPDPNKPTCNPDTRCFGKGANHVGACFNAAVVDTQTTQAPPKEETQEPNEGWVITKGGAAGNRINDEAAVTPADLKTLRDFYLVAIDDSVPPVQLAELRGESAEVEKEIKRRGLFEYEKK